MAKKLVTILNSVLSQSAHIRKSAFATSNDVDDVQMIEIANRVRQEIVDFYDWPQLRRQGMITIIGSQRRYVLPSDYRSLVPDSMFKGQPEAQQRNRSRDQGRLQSRLRQVSRSSKIERFNAQNQCHGEHRRQGRSGVHPRRYVKRHKGQQRFGYDRECQEDRMGGHYAHSRSKQPRVVVTRPHTRIVGVDKEVVCQVFRVQDTHHDGQVANLISVAKAVSRCEGGQQARKHAKQHRVGSGQ